MLTPNERLDLLRVSIKNNFLAGLPGLESQSDPLVLEIPTNTASDVYPIADLWPQIREWVGDRQYKSLGEKSYVLGNRPWEATIEVPRPALMDDSLGIYYAAAKNYGASIAQFRDREVFSCLEAGTTALCYDGESFFSDSHPVGEDGETAVTTVSNIDTSDEVDAWYLFDLRWPIKPLIVQKRQDFEFQSMDYEHDEHVFTKNSYRYGLYGRFGFGYGLWQLAYRSTAEITGTNLDAAFAAMRGLTRDKGHKMGVRPTLLVHGQSNQAAVNMLLKSEVLANGQTNVYFNKIATLDCDWID
jgi:phage major head subunit gpT-like protein